MSAADLDTALHGAAARGDAAALVGLYLQAAAGSAGLQAVAGGEGRAAFFLTQALICALEAGDPRAAALRARLRAMGREA